MALTQDQKKQFRKIAHHLNPVVIIADKGLSEAVEAELQRALEDHELIKVRVNALDREAKQEIIQAICQTSGSELVQTIGHIAVIYRPAKKPNPKLSNLLRYRDA